MADSSVEETQDKGREKDTGKSWASLDVHGQHRRSKSASEWNLDTANDATHHQEKEPNISHDFPPTKRANRGKSPLHQEPNGTKIECSSNQRASLEKDIEELHLRLQQEKSMRIMLERAMGRVSSTLSPGHRHVAVQTKELITEIELLEEEVTNREQHVLSLYRSIFENCVSSAPSRQSSGMTSPAHSKTEVRKHPSVISSTLCSSSKKYLPLQPFQALATIKEFRKRNVPLQSKARHSSLLSGQTNHAIEKVSDPMKVNDKVPILEKPSFALTLKDHLHQCPSKLSEELVKCMAAIYCWLQTAASTKSGKNRSPLLSRSSTNVILPRRGSVEDREWSCRSTMEISWISTDKTQFDHASFAINSYRVLVEQLEKVNTSQMESDAQLAFWINVYNSLIMHAYLAYGIPQGPLRRIALFHKAAYNIGGHMISVNAIEQSIFCMRVLRTGRWYETIISTAMRKKSGENKRVSATFSLQSNPLLCFALCTGASSDPLLKVYTATNIKEELEVAMKEFLQSNVVVKKSRKVFLPRILERYGKENCLSSDDLLNWVADNVDKKLHDSIRKCVDCSTRKKASLVIEWLPYNMRFQYKFAKELTEKPWWV